MLAYVEEILSTEVDFNRPETARADLEAPMAAVAASLAHDL